MIQKRTEPAFIEPMQCKPVTALPAGEKWMFEIKFDGYRCIAVKRGSGGHAILAPQEGAQQALPQAPVYRADKIPTPSHSASAHRPAEARLSSTGGIGSRRYFEWVLEVAASNSRRLVQ